MATLVLKINRSDRYPVGQVVGIFPGISRHETVAARPAGKPLAEATVEPDGSLTFTTLEPGQYTLYGEVGEEPRTMSVGLGPAPVARPLRERLARRRYLLGV